MEIFELETFKQRWMLEVHRKIKQLDASDYARRSLLFGFLVGAGMLLKDAKEIADNAPGNGWRI